MFCNFYGFLRGDQSELVVKVRNLSQGGLFWCVRILKQTVRKSWQKQPRF